MPVPKRAATTLVLLVFGGALAVATWVSGEHGFAVALGLFYVVAGAITYVVAGGQSDVAAIMRTDGDERQRSIDRDATVLAAYAIVGFAILASIVQIARGEDAGAFLAVCAVGGVSYVVALAVLRHRR